MVKIFFKILMLFMGSVLLLNIHAHFSDSESYLNTVSSIDKNKDYDQDGATENAANSIEVLKDNQLVLWETTSRLEIITIVCSAFLIEHTHSLYQLLKPAQFTSQVFRPPILT